MCQAIGSDKQHLIKAQKSGFVYRITVGDLSVLMWTDTYEQRLADKLADAIALLKELLADGDDDGMGEWNLAYVDKVKARIAELERL